MNYRTLIVIGIVGLIVGAVVWANVRPAPPIPPEVKHAQFQRDNDNYTSLITANERYTVFTTSLGNDGVGLVIFDNETATSKILRTKGAGFFSPRFAGANRSELLFVKVSPKDNSRELIRCDASISDCRAVFQTEMSKSIITPELLADGTYAFYSSPRRERLGGFGTNVIRYEHNNLHFYNEQSRELRKVNERDYRSASKLIALGNRLMVSVEGYQEGFLLDDNYDLCTDCLPRRPFPDNLSALSDVDPVAGFAVYVSGYLYERDIGFFDRDSGEYRRLESRNAVIKDHALDEAPWVVPRGNMVVSHGVPIGTSRIDYFVLDGKFKARYFLMSYKIDENIYIKRGEVKTPIAGAASNFIELDSLMK